MCSKLTTCGEFTFVTFHAPRAACYCEVSSMPGADSYARPQPQCQRWEDTEKNAPICFSFSFPTLMLHYSQPRSPCTNASRITAAHPRQGYTDFWHKGSVRCKGIQPGVRQGQAIIANLTVAACHIRATMGDLLTRAAREEVCFVWYKLHPSELSVERRGVNQSFINPQGSLWLLAGYRVVLEQPHQGMIHLSTSGALLSDLQSQPGFGNKGGRKCQRRGLVSDRRRPSGSVCAQPAHRPW